MIDPAGWRARLLSGVLRVVVRPQMARARDPVRARARFLMAARWLFRDPPFAASLPGHLAVTDGRMPVLWAWVAGRRDRGVLLYFHGGAYVMGSPRTHRALALALAAPLELQAVLPRYPLAPEHPFPAAFEGALDAYRGLLALGHAPGRIVLAGDSAGGGLALALLAEIGRLGLPAPAGLVAFSPLTDLAFAGRSITANAARDALLPAERRRDLHSLVLQGADPRDPRISPLHGAWPVPPPPVHLFASDSEILRDDALRMAERLRAAGGRVTCDIFPDLPHAWPIFRGWIPEADAALDRAARSADGWLPAGPA